MYKIFDSSNQIKFLFAEGMMTYSTQYNTINYNDITKQKKMSKSYYTLECTIQNKKRNSLKNAVVIQRTMVYN